MQQTLGYCKRCNEKRRGPHLQKILDRLSEKYPKRTIETNCQSVCGPGAKRPFITIDKEAYFFETEEEMFEFLEAML